MMPEPGKEHLRHEVLMKTRERQIGLGKKKKKTKK